MKMTTRLILVLALALSLGACGKKGDVKPPSRAATFSASSVTFLS